MNGYQRFISYVYEYRKGKKTENCGFIKVEEWSGKCIIDVRIRCRGLAANQEAKLYGFVRKDKEMQGILLGVLVTEDGILQGLIETEAENLHGSNISLRTLGGMILTLESGGFYGTEWDDFPIYPDCFLEMHSETSMVSEPIPFVEKDNTMEETYSTEGKHEESVDSSDIQEEAISIFEIEERENKDLKEKDVEEKKTDPTEKIEIIETIEENEKEVLKKENIPEFDPFEDGEIQECRKITPQYITNCNRKDWALRNNRFLLYGFYHFGHLLFGKLRDGQYILGVPGIYDQQERFMANMFGFPHFKESMQISVSQAKGGYWYRLIYPPNENGGNSSF